MRNNKTYRPELLYARPYYNDAPSTDPRSGETYEACNAIKYDANYTVPHIELYAYELLNDDVLVPIPGHDGSTASNMAFARQLQKAAAGSAKSAMYVRKIEIIDALTCDPRESLCDAKRAGRPTDGIDLTMRVKNRKMHDRIHKILSDGRRPVLVDNIVDTGATVLAACEALGAECYVMAIGYTGNDTRLYNPLKMLETFTDKLDKSYTLTSVDYRDEYPAQLVEQCLEEKSIFPLTERDDWDDARCRASDAIASEIIESSSFETRDKEDFKDSKYFDELRYEIEDRDESFPEKDCLLKMRLRCRVELDSNYDCWIPPYDAGALRSKDTALWGLMAELSLNPRKVKEEVAHQHWMCGIEGPWPDIKAREGKELVSYKDFVEVLSDCPNYGKWSFFGFFDMRALYDAGFETDGLVIPIGTTCTMYNSWNGGGSCTFAATLREITVAELKRRAARYKDGASVLVDEKGCGRGYASSEVYGGSVSEDKILTA